jgi:hypothetical protein
MTNIKPGQRLRCVNGTCTRSLRVGETYTFHHGSNGLVVLVELPDREFSAERFKPVVRVPARCVPSLNVLVRRANAAHDLLTPAQQAEHWNAQRESWVRSCTGAGAD